MAFGPDAEVKDQVMVELLQKWAVALSQNLIQQQLTRKQNVHVHHTAWNLQQKRPRVISHVFFAQVLFHSFVCTCVMAIFSYTYGLMTRWPGLMAYCIQQARQCSLSIQNTRQSFSLRQWPNLATLMWLLGHSFLSGCSTLTSHISTHPVRQRAASEPSAVSL